MRTSHGNRHNSKHHGHANPSKASPSKASQCGNKLIRHCRGILHNAELRIQTLSNPETAQEEQDGAEPDDPDTNEFSLT